ncbi:hypothetical protein CDD83_398 [Cordyceps sp. RAO-2017]|nr:hypothetical protein CDD83_398 [Cordyceps sp. RAO-2017]
MRKVARKLKEEPLVPLGAGLTVFAFVSAYRAIRRGDSQQANRMFRARVAAQGLTVLAMVAGSIFYSQDREKTKELRKLQEQREAEEKRQRWIRELEVRDEEVKAFKAKLERRKRDFQDARPSPSDEASQSATDGGILGRMGLWSQGAKTAEQQQQQEEESMRREDAESTTAAADPDSAKSSLGAIGEMIASKKKEKAGSKPIAEGEPETREKP